jgi:hypothetical protein
MVFATMDYLFGRANVGDVKQEVIAMTQTTLFKKLYEIEQQMGEWHKELGQLRIDAANAWAEEADDKGVSDESPVENR